MFAMFMVRNIIGTFMTTSAWTGDAIEKMFDCGRQGFGLYVLVFGTENMQPYFFAITVELPLQLQLFHDSCRSAGVSTDTTALNAQLSEHVNKMLKTIEKLISTHWTVTAENSIDISKHFQSRYFIPFLREYVTKNVALRLHMQTPDDISSKTHNNKANHVLPADGACSFCGQRGDDHRQICEHKWAAALKQTIRDCKRHPELVRLLESSEAKTLLVPNHDSGDEVGQIDQPARVVSVSTEQRKMRKIRAEKKKTSYRGRRRHRR
jgi:hypothetical protein